MKKSLSSKCTTLSSKKKSVSKKNVKKKKSTFSLFVLFLVLAFFAGLLAFSTYSWFIANTRVRTNEINIDVGKITSLMVSADAENWSNSINLEDLQYADGLNQLPVVVDHCSSSGKVVDNFLRLYHGILDIDDMHDEIYLTSVGIGNEINCFGFECPENVYFTAFDVYFLAEQPIRTIITNGAGVYTSDDKGLQNAVRVAFVNEGFVDAYEEGAVEKIRGMYEGTEAILWEPNYDEHIDSARRYARKYYNMSSVPDTPLQYYAMDAAIAGMTKVNIKETSDSIFFVNMDDFDGTFIKTKKKHSSIPFISLEPGITKIRVYVWIEGQDIDAEDNSSGSVFELNLEFAIDG